MTSQGPRSPGHLPGNMLQVRRLVFLSQRGHQLGQLNPVAGVFYPSPYLTGLPEADRANACVMLEVSGSQCSWPFRRFF